jgi:hypothetical protein
LVKKTIVGIKIKGVYLSNDLVEMIMSFDIIVSITRVHAKNKYGFKKKTRSFVFAF